MPSIAYKFHQPPLFAYDPKSSLIGEITPDVFLDLASPTLPDTHAVDHYAEHIRSGAMLDLPFLTIDRNGEIVGHEGRHRVIASKKTGVARIPVIFDFQFSNLYPSKTFPSYPEGSIINTLRSERTDWQHNIETYQKIAHLPAMCSVVSDTHIKCQFVQQLDQTKSRSQQTKEITIQIANFTWDGSDH